MSIRRRSILKALPYLWLGADMRALPLSAPDPGNIFFEKGNLANSLPYSVVTGKSSRALSINPSEDTLIMICAGQSLATNSITDTFTPTNGSKLDNLAWYDGTNWAATTPLLGTSWGGTVGTSVNFNHKIADGIISNGKFDRVIIVAVALPGTPISYHITDYIGGEPAGYYRMIQAAAKKLAAQGVRPGTPGVKFLLKWNQGESDTQQFTTQSAYTAYFNTLMALCAIDLPGVPWMVAKETRYLGVNSGAVQAAQLALVNGTTIFAGENMDSIGSSGRIGDDTHLNATGGGLAATMGIAAITAISF